MHTLLHTSKLPLAVCAFLAGLASGVSAQPLHAGDVFPAVQSGVLTVTNGATINPAAAARHSVLGAIGGQRLFSGNFRDLRGGALVTDNPGFHWTAGAHAGDTGFPQGSLLGFLARGALSFWNGSEWHAAPPGVTVSLDDALARRSTWSAGGISSATDFGYIGASGAGGIHTHLDFRISSATPTGAWLINLSLFSQVAPADLFNPPAPSPGNRSPGIADSTPFTLVFNGGLAAADFNRAITSLTEAPPVPVPVPLPAGTLAFAAGSLMLSALGNRRLRPAG